MMIRRYFARVQRPLTRPYEPNKPKNLTQYALNRTETVAFRPQPRGAIAKNGHGEMKGTEDAVSVAGVCL